MQEYLLSQFRLCVPRPSPEYYKGQLGRIGIVGGCLEYTGAPYFAAASSLEVGSDLSYIFCSKNSATPIKSYSPETIVLPILRTVEEAREELDLGFEDLNDKNLVQVKSEIAKNLKTWVRPLDAIVIGPGMGRDDLMIYSALEAIGIARELGKPIVIDGDGLWAIGKNLDSIKNYKNTILTPNIAEYGRLVKQVLGWEVDKSGLPTDEKILKEFKTDEDHSESASETARQVLVELAKKLGEVTILKKGPVDFITDGKALIQCSVPSGVKRCGGQGDILSGITGAFLGWNYSSTVSRYDLLHQKVQSLESKNENTSGIRSEDLSKTLLAAYGASCITRTSSFNAFRVHGMSLTCTKIVRSIGSTFEDVCQIHH